MKKILFSCLFLFMWAGSAWADSVIWSIGQQDQSSADLAMGPVGYQDFLKNDFGYEDRYYLVGTSSPRQDFPYVIPGPSDGWGGTWFTSGWRTHEANILFGLRRAKPSAKARLIVSLLCAGQKGSKVKISVNRKDTVFTVAPGVQELPKDSFQLSEARQLVVDLTGADLCQGGNLVNISLLEGSWVAFDQIRLEAGKGVEADLARRRAFLRSVTPAAYQVNRDGVQVQPLLVDVEHVDGKPQVQVLLDGKQIYSAILDSARYMIEAPMPAVSRPVTGRYTVLIDNEVVQTGKVARAPQHAQTPADYVDTRLGAAHSRWMIAPGPWMPFGMVKISPDNQNKGWQSGYQPSFESIGCFSHIHEWTMAGLGMMPTCGPLKIEVGDEAGHGEGYRADMDKRSEEAPLGYYKVHLKNGIWAEITATERTSFQRYTFEHTDCGRVMIDLQIPSEYDYRLGDVEMRKVGDRRIEGYSRQLAANVWSNDAEQDYTLYFVIEFDRPILRIGAWHDGIVISSTDRLQCHDLDDAGMFVEFDTQSNPVVQARVGVSPVSVANAAENLALEQADKFGWNFEAIVQNQKDVWNDILTRIDITTDDRLEKVRFYTNMYHALCRNLWSDNNGQWKSTDGKVRQLPKGDVALGGDAFWNTFWNLNQFWNLVTPEWSSRWVRSELAMYEANGWLAKGPAGMNYIPVMVAEHEIPLMVSAWQMGIRDFDAHKVLEAAVKMQTTPSTKVHTGYAGNRDLEHYLRYHYVPYQLGRYSNSLEYSYDDWTVGQLAKALGEEETYRRFNERGYWWRNAFNPATGYAALRDTLGQFKPDFDPFRDGINAHYVEGNAWQLSFFVPQDVPALVDMIGADKFVSRLNWGFEACAPWRYNAPGDQYWDYPVVQGNQQSMHFAFLFNWAGKPWLTQRWSRSVAERYYGCGVANAYLGDEDQGQMSAWFLMAALGLFQTDGGCRVEPIYEIASPLYTKAVIRLGGRYGRGDSFVIEAKNNSRANVYVQRAWLNGQPLDSFCFPASELLRGGSLVLEMGPEPNYEWGVSAFK